MNSSKKYDEYVKNLEIRIKELESYLRGCHDIFDSVREYIPQELVVLIRMDFVAVSNQIAEMNQKIYVLSEQQTEQMKKDHTRENLEQ